MPEDGLFGGDKHWRGMPEFEQQDLSPYQTLPVHFRCDEDREAFARLIGRRLTKDTRSIWYPPEIIGRYADKQFVTETPVNPRHPVYVISKGRWESRLTVKALEAMGVPYHVVVEPQEQGNYAAVIDPRKILVLPFSNLGQGSIPARNWVWEHAVESGAQRHWILDDNINGFYRLANNLKTPAGTGAVFRAAEDFVDRYENVAMAGFNYFMFASRKTKPPPYYLNTRIYSCILLKNDLPFRWRGRYNEDTDLSLRALKAGYCTALFNAFPIKKVQTMTMRGGNTEELYQADGRLQMARSLEEQHPDVARTGTRWGRPQHQVNYGRFRRNRLKPKTGINAAEGPDEYGMRLQKKVDGRWTDAGETG